MKPFKFAHTADLHLDSPFSGISYINERVAERLREATFQTFDRIVDLCLEHAVVFLLVAGDVYDSKDRSLRAQLRFRDGLTKLSQAGILTFVVHGNHDPMDSRLATLKWPEQVHFFSGDKVDCIPVERAGRVIAHVYGMSYPTQDIRQNLAVEFRRRIDSPFAIGLLHCNVGGNTGHEPYAPCTTEDLSKSGMDYWGLGHVHNHAILSREKPTIVYAGNPQGRHPAELGPRGCYLVEVGAGGHCTPKFIPTDSVRWLLDAVDIEGLENDEAIVSAAQDVCCSIREKTEGLPAVCRIVFTGRGPAHHSLSKPGFVDDLTRTLRDTEGNQEPFVWVERIQVNTRPQIDIDALRNGQDFVSDFLRIGAERRDDSDFLNEIRSRLSVLFDSRLGRDFLEQLEDDEIKLCFDMASAQCLDLLTAERD
jgi:DNA repair exonuclease SbcCD nuclease subunit